jgi:hypothetical protein
MNQLLFHWKSWFNNQAVRKDNPDVRDYELETGSVKYPKEFRQLTKPALNQGKYNNCTNYAVASIMEDLRGFNSNDLSRFYLWTKARLYEGRFPKNEGVYSRTVMNILNKQGIEVRLNHTENPNYKPNNIDDLTARAVRGNGVQYLRGRNITDIKRGLVEGYGVYIALRVTNEISRYTGGIIDKIKNPNYGFGHAVHCIGYNNTNNYLLIKNSWGTSWGENGNFRINYDSFNNIVYDIWLIKPL